MMSNDALTSRYREVVGRTFRHLTFVRLSDKRGDGGRFHGIFRCACGKDYEVAIGRVLKGLRTHCGCKANRRPNLKHGMRNSREYSTWMSMKLRCRDPNNKDYPRWGGKGITICDEWFASFEDFYAHIGPRPSGMTIDRIDNLRGYEPGNVRWATASEQQRNRKTAYRWHVKDKLFESCTEAAQYFGVSDHTVWRWVHGQHDKRRNSFTPPREDCHVISRY